MTKVQLGSPWLEQLEQRSPIRLHGNHHTDVAVVGAGIAGVTTAYFLLKQTWQRVTLIEGSRIAHGATGHNAGQLVSYFERPFTEIVNEFGLDMAAAGQRDVESAWDLLTDIHHDLGLTTPYQTFTGYAGCVDLTELMVHLRNNEQRLKAGLVPETILVSQNFTDLKHIPRSLKKVYQVVPHEQIRDLLQTKDRHYIALLAGKKGVMNSARFCDEAVTKLRQRYPNRLTVAEHTLIRTVKLYKRGADLISGARIIQAKRVVLCTNGFERLKIENHAGADIDVKFHHLVRGSVGYMAAFVEKPQMAPTAVSYLPSHLKDISGAYDSDPYYYLTRRPHHDNNSLVCIGGPEALMDDTNAYSQEHPYPKEAKQMIDDFVQRTYQHTGRRLTYTHLWHGLMGYTPNGIRCVGAEPCNPVLLYNLGCNGVGILPSIQGSLRIARIIKGKNLPPSIFDPADLRCMLPGTRSEEDAIASDRWLERHTVWGFIVFWSLTVTTLLTIFWAKAEFVGANI
jgi:glycine/D-amino acid oxidase-like deaminating enzyme